MAEIANKCPVCCNNCNCKFCLRRVKKPEYKIKMSDIARHSYYVLQLLLPWLKEFSADQYVEKAFEANIKGLKPTELKLQQVVQQKDDNLFCKKCRISIIDFHRSCPTCSYALCIICCRELRQTFIPQSGGTSDEYGENNESAHSVKPYHKTKFWKVSNTGNITCPPKEIGGCGISIMHLKRMIPEEDLFELDKKATEIVGSNSSKFNNIYDRTSRFTGSRKIDNATNILCKAAHRDDSNDNYLYSPSTKNLQKGELENFQKHWVKGEPVIVRDVLDLKSGLSWDPKVLWRAFRDKKIFKGNSEKFTVKVIDFMDWCEANVSIEDFISGYEVGLTHYTSSSQGPALFKLKDWPPYRSFSEGLLRHVVDFIAALPFPEYTHPMYGTLNLAVKFPEVALRPNLGPRTYISYGYPEELGIGDSVEKLHCRMYDTVNVLTHTSDVTDATTEICEDLENLDETQKFCRNKSRRKRKFSCRKRKKISSSTERNEQPIREDFRVQDGNASESNKRKCQGGGKRHIREKQIGVSDELANDKMLEGGALWDIFRKKDVPKLRDYLTKHSGEFNHVNCSCLPLEQVAHPIQDQCYYLNIEHKRMLKEEFGIEPWTFVQKLGDAVFIPAGCPHQVRNLKPCIKVALDFVSPENLNECIRIADDIRKLQKDHKAKKDQLEVQKMAIQAIRQVVENLESCIAKPGFKDMFSTAETLDDPTRKLCTIAVSFVKNEYFLMCHSLGDRKVWIKGETKLYLVQRRGKDVSSSPRYLVLKRIHIRRSNETNEGSDGSSG